MSAPEGRLMAEESSAAELVTFSCRECYVYQIPPAGTVGHRAANWDVDNWLQAVSLSVVAAGNDCYVRLLDKDTGSLFAECPVPEIALTAIEPVVDSSRYFVIRVVDRQTHRHAFIGVGFRERTQASDFNAALHDHGQYLQRQKQAEERRAAYEASEAEASPSGAGCFSSQDLSLKPGVTIRLKLGGKDQEPASSIGRRRAEGQPAMPQFGSTSASGVPCLGPPPQSAAPMRTSGEVPRGPDVGSPTGKDSTARPALGMRISGTQSFSQPPGTSDDLQHGEPDSKDSSAAADLQRLQVGGQERGSSPQAKGQSTQHKGAGGSSGHDSEQHGVDKSGSQQDDDDWGGFVG